MYYSLCQFFSLTGSNRGTLHLFSSFPSVSRLSFLKSLFFNARQAALNCLSHFSWPCAFLDIPPFSSLPPLFSVLFLRHCPPSSVLSSHLFSFLFVCLYFSLSPLSCPSRLSHSASPPSTSHSGTRLSNMAVNCIALTQSEFSVRGHLFQAIVGCW